MPGSKTNSMTREQVLAAVRAIPPETDFVWDGKDEDDRPATAEEMQAAIKKRGRPAGKENKEQVSVRYSPDVLAAFRATGRGWQTRMDEALKDWLKSHHLA